MDDGLNNSDREERSPIGLYYIFFFNSGTNHFKKMQIHMVLVVLVFAGCSFVQGRRKRERATFTFTDCGESLYNILR